MKSNDTKPAKQTLATKKSSKKVTKVQEKKKSEAKESKSDDHKANSTAVV